MLFRSIAADASNPEAIGRLLAAKRRGRDMPPPVLIGEAAMLPALVAEVPAVSNILPEEDMPFFADGTPMDVVLNPLGVPSRMNIGQIMETHLGWASKTLGRQIAAMVDEGVALVRKEIKTVFDSEEISRMVDEMADDELIAAAKSLSNNIIIKTPVFDGAEEDEIWK